MYDVDGNGVIDQDEMTKIVQVDKHLNAGVSWKRRPRRINLVKSISKNHIPRKQARKLQDAQAEKLTS